MSTNELDRVILDQYKRVSSVVGDPRDVLEEVQGEVLAVATPALTLEIITDHTRAHPDSETRTCRAQIRAFQDPRSIGSRALKEIQMANGLARIEMLVPNQGYVGGIVFDYNEPTVYGHSMDFDQIKPDDPVQEAGADTFYPPMMWVKALRAATYANRPESAQNLSVAEYLAKLGLSLGSVVNEYGDLVGATGFMPGTRLQGKWANSFVQTHVDSEANQTFKLSGLCDQAVVDSNILLRTEEFAEDILLLNGSLN